MYKVSNKESLFQVLALSILIVLGAVSCGSQTPPAEPRIVTPDSVQILSSNYYDGPYLVYENEDAVIFNGKEQAGQMILDTRRLPSNELKTISVYKSGLSPRTFSVELKPEINPQPSIYAAVDSIFAVSDIEGNFNTLTNLMQQHGVINSQLDWTFGSGHFVLIGDIFDRGNHVTEMLWFLYALEAKAEAAGGVVHILLGNHEALNLRGDLRYIEPKYSDFALLAKDQVGLEYTDLIGPESELGRWLRSKNVIERIGDKLFVHAGISPVLIKSGYSIEKINDLARRNMDTPKADFTDDDKLMWGKAGPFWYRGYFDINEEKWGPRATQTDVDAALEYFEASLISVGHTHVEKPELRYNGRVCAINVKPPADHKLYLSPVHAYGVLFKAGKIFVADDQGQLVELSF